MTTTTIIGLVAACLTTFAFLPQTIQVIKTKQTKDISLNMYIALTIGVVLWLIYGILLSEIPIIIANGITLVFSVVILSLKLKYK